MGILSDIRLQWTDERRGIAGDAAPPSAEAAKAPEPERMEMLGRLVGGVAHDFANILTMIAGYSDILLSRIGEKDPLRRELNEIREAANRGARLTEQLLGFTRGQAVQPRPLDLNALVRNLERMLRLIAGESVELDLVLAPELHNVMADPGQMEQVIMNLVLNARDAIPAAGRIRIETANGGIPEAAAADHALRPGACAMLSISDNGHGIAPETLARIFEPFFTTKGQGRGTGLGLSTVHRIVEETGGLIRVLSTPGEGSTFTVWLPSAGEGAVKPETDTTPAAAVDGSETVLLVEDDDGVRRLLMHALHQRGYKVLEAANGEEALQIFRQRESEISLVLTDMVMPQMGGRELGETLRAIRPDLKIVFMSGYTDEVLVRAGALSPGMPFLPKPLRPGVLAAKVRETLDGAGPGAHSGRGLPAGN